MDVEESRLRTFRNWPANAPVEASRIAQAGFYYCGPGLGVRCFSCECHITEWNYGDQAMARHRNLSPDCPFVRDPASSGNVPLTTLPVADRSITAPSTASATTPTQSPTRRVRVDRCLAGRCESQTTVYRSEAARLESFDGWPIPFIVTPESLAAAGFYFLHQGDKVQCAFCSGMISRWEEGDIPEAEHRRHFPSCPFLLGIPVGNIPFNRHSRSTTNERLCNFDNMEDLGIQRHRGPKHAKYSTYESRLRTYSNWPADLVQRPPELSQAGFFYVGDQVPGLARDQVRCFHCDGGLKQFEEEDDPWNEHARWFPNCPFLVLVKGQEFVDQIQSLYTSSNRIKSSTSTSGNAASGSSTGGGGVLDNKMLQVGGLSVSMPSLSGAHSSQNENISRTQSVTENLTLEEENRRLKEARQCKICMDAEVGAVLLPCGHLVACVDCALSLHNCPVCRKQIKATIRTFLS